MTVENNPVGTPVSFSKFLREKKYRYTKSFMNDANDSYCGIYKTIRYKSQRNQTLDVIITTNSPELFVQMCKNLSIFDIWFDGDNIYYTTQFHKAIAYNVCIYKLNHLNSLHLSKLEQDLRQVVKHPVNILICSQIVIEFAYVHKL